MIKRNLLLLGLACALAASCDRGDEANEIADGNAAAAGEASQERSNIGEALAGSADHTEFVQALQSAGLIEVLRGVGPYTVFAPSDAAFEAVPEDARAQLAAPEQRERMIALLSYHIVPGTVTVQDIGRAVERGEGGRAELATVTGANLSLWREGDAIMVGDGSGGRARITGADQVQANGVVHSIDSVLMPAGGG